MDLYLRTGLAAAVELLVLFVIGGLLQPAADDGETSVCETILSGFVTMLAELEAAALPSTAAGITLSAFFMIWAASLSLLIAASCVLHYRGFFRATAWHARNFQFTPATMMMVIGATSLAAFSVLTAGDADTSHVISQTATDLYTDTIGRTDGLTGAALETMPVTVLITRYHLADAFCARLFGIPVLTQMKLVRQGLTVILSLMAGYRIFFRLLGRSKRRAGWATLFMTSVLLLTATGETAQAVLLRTGWTGNAALTGIVFPYLILLMLSLTDHPESFRAKCLLFLTGVAAVSLSETAIYLTPAAILVTFLPAILIRKRWSLLPHMLLSLIVPSVCVLIGLIGPAFSL